MSQDKDAEGLRELLMAVQAELAQARFDLTLAYLANRQLLEVLRDDAKIAVWRSVQRTNDAAVGA